MLPPDDVPDTMKVLRSRLSYSRSYDDTTDKLKHKFLVEHLRLVVDHLIWGGRGVIDYYGPFFYDDSLDDVGGWWSIVTYEGHGGPRPSVHPHLQESP